MKRIWINSLIMLISGLAAANSRAAVGTISGPFTHRNLQVDTEYSARTFKHILVPVWLVTYTFGARTFQTLVNGYSGEIAGDRPVSRLKVFFYIVIPILVILAMVLLSHR